MHTSLLLQTQVLEGCVRGQTRVCHEASFPDEGNKTLPRPLCLAQLISCHSSVTGKRRGKQRFSAAWRAALGLGLLVRLHRPCLLFPISSIVPHPELEAGRSHCLLLPHQRCQKESRAGRRKAAMLMGFATRNI